MNKRIRNLKCGLSPVTVWLLIAAAALIVVILSVGVNAADDSTPAPADDPGYMLIYGGRLQSDMLFYGQFGIKADTYDVTLGLGWNNSIWVGGHTYFFAGDGIAAFSGLELHIEYPAGETIELHPALPLGFAVEHDKLVWIVEALILPSLAGQPVTAIFALSFLFGL